MNNQDMKDLLKQKKYKALEKILIIKIKSWYIKYLKEHGIANLNEESLTLTDIINIIICHAPEIEGKMEHFIRIVSNEEISDEERVLDLMEEYQELANEN